MRARSMDCRHAAYALMALHALLSDAAAASQLIGNARLAGAVFKGLASRAVNKQCTWVRGGTASATSA